MIKKIKDWTVISAKIIIKNITVYLVPKDDETIL